jgi:hypothetical protein
MAEKISIMLKRSEYWVVYIFISLTMIVWFATILMEENMFAPVTFPAVIAGSTFIVLATFAVVLYWRARKVKSGQEFMDERSNMCTLRATRNAFIVSLLFLALYMILEQIAPASSYNIPAPQGVFGVSVAAYLISYFFYRQVD